MKKIITLLFTLTLAYRGTSQIPNAGFENWSNGEPVGWSTSNGQFAPIVQVSNAHSGNSAMKMQWQFNGNVGASVHCPAFDSTGFDKFPFTGRPAALTGWYISSFGAGDYLKVTCVLYKNSNPIGFVSNDIYGSSATYKQFSLPITYSVAGNADSASINMILLYSGTPDFSSFALLDDIAFATTTGLRANEVNPPSTMLLFTDPVSNRTRIEYQSGIDGLLKLSVRDIHGKTVKTLINSYQTAGQYRIDESFDDFQKGIYLVDFESPQGSCSRKLCLIR